MLGSCPGFSGAWCKLFSHTRWNHVPVVVPHSVSCSPRLTFVSQSLPLPVSSVKSSFLSPLRGLRSPDITLVRCKRKEPQWLIEAILKMQLQWSQLANVIIDCNAMSSAEIDMTCLVCLRIWCCYSSKSLDAKVFFQSWPFCCQLFLPTSSMHCDPLPFIESCSRQFCYKVRQTPMTMDNWRQYKVLLEIILFFVVCCKIVSNFRTV